MRAIDTCPECGTAIPPDAPKGFCPACLVRVGAGDILSDASERPEGASVALRGPIAHGSGYPILFGGYELLEEIGRGGMGVVHRARQLSLNRTVALKMLLHGRFSDPAFIERFHLEAEAAAHLDHPKIVPIYEVGLHDGQPYYTMKLIEGHSLEGELSRGPMPPEKAAQLMVTVAHAVTFAHRHGVLHRDIKPHNILIDAEGQPHLTDFGLAKLLDQESGLTLSAAVIGSPGFMAPEQAAGKTKQMTTAADVYGLGAVLYALLAGQPPFAGTNLVEVLRRVAEEEPVRPSQASARSKNKNQKSKIDSDLETICLKCLQKEPAKRYASAHALAEDLECWLRAEPIQARRATQVERLWLWCRRQPVRAGLLGALILVFALGLAGVLWQWRRATAGELFASQNAYAADMNLAQRALQENNLGLATSLLNKHRPAGRSSSDFRHWEWRYLWQLCQPDESVRLQTNPGSIGAIAISQDGKVEVVQTGNAKVAVWDLTSKRQVAELRSVASIGILGLSPTGNLLAVSTRISRGEPSVQVWDLHPQKIRATLSHRWPLNSMAFSPNTTLLATFDDHGNIAVMEWLVNRTLTNLLVLPPRHMGSGIVVFSPDGNQLAIGEDYGRTSLLNWRTGAMVTMTNLTAGGTPTGALAFSPDGELLAAGFGGAIRLWEASSGAPRGRLDAPAGAVQALAFTPDGRRLASAGTDRAIRIWSVPDQVELSVLRGHAGEGRGLAFWPDGRTLVSGCEEAAACFWDVAASNRLPPHTTLAISFGVGAQAALEPPSFAPEALDPRTVRRFGFAFTPGGEQFITTGRYGSLGVCDARDVRLMEALPALGSNNWGVALSADGQWLAAGNTSGKVNVWDWEQRRLIKTLEVPFEWFGFLGFSPSTKFLLARLFRQGPTVSVRIWRTDGWVEVPLAESQTAGIMAVDLSPDDRLLATGYADGTVKLWSFPSGARQTTILNHKGLVTNVLFSPDGQVLGSTSFDGHVELWDVLARRPLATLRGHLGGVWGMSFSPDGRRLATGGGSKKDAIKLWDLPTEREILTLEGEGEFFYPVAFSHDGTTIMASSFTGVAHVWRAPSWAEIEVAEKREELMR